MLDFTQDGRSSGCPDEWFGLFVVFADIVIDGFDQLGDAAEGATADSLAGDFRKPAFDQVEPGTAGGGEVQTLTGVGGKPLHDLGMFMGAVIVEHQVNRYPLGCLTIDFLQEAEELDVAMPLHTATDYRAQQEDEGSKQQSGAVAAVIVGLAFRPTGPQW